jgi:hypothetical protein
VIGVTFAAGGIAPVPLRLCGGDGAAVATGAAAIEASASKIG